MWNPIVVLVCAMGASALLLGTPVSMRADDRIVEIRSYNLKPGTRESFHQRFVREALPMLQRSKIDVVAYGPSLHDKDSYYLMRSYESVGGRQKSEDAFYGSDEWKQGPRAAVLADIESYTTVVIQLDAATLRGLRATNLRATNLRASRETTMPTGTAASSDLDALLQLNKDYIQSVQNSDVERFKQILADDFQASLPDGSLLDRQRFLEYTAQPVKISHLEAQDVKVRILGDFAIIHARSAYKTADGRDGGGRYTDVWARRDGTWLAISAHVTRLN